MSSGIYCHVVNWLHCSISQKTELQYLPPWEPEISLVLKSFTKLSTLLVISKVNPSQYTMQAPTWSAQLLILALCRGEWCHVPTTLYSQERTPPYLFDRRLQNKSFIHQGSKTHRSVCHYTELAQVLVFQNWILLYAEKAISHVHITSIRPMAKELQPYWDCN
jgi:hypothetical protein